MRNIKYILSMLFLLQCVFSEETYDPSANALTDIKNAISLAKKTNKHVFVKVGGNWCGWCKLYARFTESDDAIMQIMNEEYVFTLVNWSTENKNLDAMAFLGNPQRFGFPVFVIIDGDGNVLHTQDSALLEQGKGYNKKHVMRFLNAWTFDAVYTSGSSAEQ
tara:strand:+ start:44 stop:529 length:486 start_codon:yes stop_codon:yes gene_type:complete